MELHIRDVSKTYPNGVQALKDVTLTIPAGMYGLLRPTDAGKSTLMRILATLQEFGVYPKVSAEHLLDHFALLEGIRGPRTVADGLHPRLCRVAGDRRDPLSASVPIRLTRRRSPHSAHRPLGMWGGMAASNSSRGRLLV